MFHSSFFMSTLKNIIKKHIKILKEKAYYIYFCGVKKNNPNNPKIQQAWLT
ncbi:hypothetical protein EV201_2418 [Ancylomarina subtilis]|uniref:Uncharacterized protein n=1 Tax=Ancylomarina subtilis TaxID=1639035 RepID=A0A4Q7V955_9BACT|nr:hypothetical protein EV201_2418 [Ancylomarina subtilis]